MTGVEEIIKLLRNTAIDEIACNGLLNLSADTIEILQVKITELTAYRTAEEQGLLVRLLPIDKRVFIVEDGEIFEFRVYQYSLLSVNNKNVRYWAECISDENEDDLDFWQDEIGKAVFLTREEAERALEGGE